MSELGCKPISNLRFIYQLITNIAIAIYRNRWSRCVEWTNKKLGMAVGSLYIRDHFKHDSKVIN